MVRKISVLLLITTSCQAAQPARPILVEWTGSRGAPCQRLIESFLAELRGIAADRRILLDTPAAAPAQPATDQLMAAEPRRLAVSCDAQDSVLFVKSGSETLRLNYLAKATGFDAADWVPLQERFLRPEPETISLAPPTLLHPTDSESPVPPASKPAAAFSEAAAPASSPPVYQRWWFWALTAAVVGAGAIALLHPFQSDPSTINVEIH